MPERILVDPSFPALMGTYLLRTENYRRKTANLIGERIEQTIRPKDLPRLENPIKGFSENLRTAQTLGKLACRMYYGKIHFNAIKYDADLKLVA